ncbi:hypothetical protein [Natrinema sp. 74]|uniref:hypothetical protein n=1 Tax=Natrinema sp. 74 TaxID=3384159 RepID=UPI0038D46F45
MQDGTVIDAAHQFVNTDGQLAVYLDTRHQGIDARINLDNVKAVLTSDDAEALLIDDRESDRELVADGGTVIGTGDLVNHDNQIWKITRMNEEYAELHAQDASPRVAPLNDVERVNGGEGSW